MALFGKNKNTKELSTKQSVDLPLILPRITEKAAIQSEFRVYAFNVPLTANKKDIASAVLSQYKIEPEKVRIVSIPAKKVTLKGKKGSTKRGKKAYVYLKEGDKIEFV